MTNPQDQLFDFYRVGLKATGEVIRASLEGAERLRKQQLAVINEALASNTRLIAEIDNTKRIEELVGVVGKHTSVQYQAAIGYWKGIFQLTGESQAEVARRAQAQAEQIRENLHKTLITAPGGSVPVVAALQPLMDVASSAYALTARAAEEAAKLTAAQLANSNGAAKSGAEHGKRKSA